MNKCIELLIEKAQDYQDDNQDRIWEAIGKKVFIGIYFLIIAGFIYFISIS